MLSPVSLFLVGWLVHWQHYTKKTERISKNLDREWVPAQSTLIHLCVKVDKGTDLGFLSNFFNIARWRIF